MKNKHNRKFTVSLFAIVYVLTMLLTALPVHVAAVDADDIQAFVDFEKSYPDYVNDFTVWGKYTGTTEDEMQILTAVYDGDGKMLYAQLGETVDLIPGESFAVEDSILLDDGEIENTVLKVFVWNSTGAVSPLGQAFQTKETVFSYTLENAARTSAGVYDDHGNLIRTLWSGEEEDAGTHTKTWDGFDDNGIRQANGKYTITVMENNVEVKADAYFGNTSDHSKYEYIMSGYANFLSDMMYVDGKMFYIYPYSEGRQSVYYFDVENPDRKAGEFGGTYRCMQRAVTDGERMYVLDTEIGMDHVFRTFVYAYDLKTWQMYMFEGMGDWTSSWGIDDHYYAVNVVEHPEEDFQTGGMGVQTNGDMMFVSYIAENKVYVLDKYNGSLINSQEFNTPRALTYSDNGGLWIGYKQDNGRYRVERYNVDANGSLSVDTSISLEHDFEYIVFVEVSPDGKKIVVADGANNQYKMYSTETGELLWTYGSGESYEEDPTIYPDKLMLKHTSNEKDWVFAEFENDNTLWVDDPGNNRAYKLDLTSGQPVVVDQIMMQPGTHSLGVDVTDPTTVYSNAIQYKIDYRKSGQDCWTPVKNWKKQVEKYNLGITALNQFNNFITLPNGRTYFSAWQDDATRLFYFEGNDAYYTGINFNDMLVLPDGRFASVRAENGRGIYRVHGISGYNEAGDPIFDEGTIVASLPIDWTEPGHIFGATKINMPITKNNVMITLRSILTKDVNDKKTWHVGGVQLGNEVATDWTWRAAPEGSEFYVGDFPDDGVFEAGNNVLNTAQTVIANGANVIAQYNGEFYKFLQTNKLYFYRDNGLLVGMFGEATWQRRDYEDRHLYGKEIYPGNAFDIYFIQDPDDSDRAYILQNNENGFGNFKYNVTGLDSIREHKIEVDMNTKLWDGLTYSYYVGDATDPANLVTKEWRGIVDREAYVTGDEFTMRYTGYIQNPNGTGNLKLYINSKETVTIKIGNQQIYQGTGGGTPEVYMEADKLYPFTCEVAKTSSTSGGKTRVILSYYDSNNKVQSFTEQDFKTDKIPYTKPGVWKVDLLEGLPFASAIANGTYGITRDTAVDTTGININTNSINDSFDDVRDLRFESNLWPTENGWWPRSAWMAKNLGTPRENLESWALEMDVCRTGYENYGTLEDTAASTGVNIDVLDVNDKVIARFHWALENKTYGNHQFVYQASDISNNNRTDELYGIPTDYHNEFNTPAPLKITCEDGMVTFEYYSGRITTEVLDPAAQWDKPAKVKLDAFFNYDRAEEAREMATFITRMDYTQYLAD